MKELVKALVTFAPRMIRYITLALSLLACIGTGILFYQQKKLSPSTAVHTLYKDANGKEVLPAGVRIGFVDIDTLEANYTYFKTRKAEFETRQKSMDADLEKQAGELQREYLQLQKQAQAGSLSQADGEAAQQRLLQKQHDLEEKRQKLTDQFLQDQDQFNKEIHRNLQHFVEQFNADKRYDFILSYLKDGSILYANKDMELTREVIKGMNEMKTDKK